MLESLASECKAYVPGLASPMGQLRLQGVALPLPSNRAEPGDSGLPYLATVLLLAGFVGRAVVRKAIGQTYVKER